MTRRERVVIKQLPSGVPGLDAVLGGGIPEYSFNLIAGEPGAGKTTLAHQIVFANATAERPALYFTVLGEPAVKMLRHQQQYSFFDAETVTRAIRFVNLADEVRTGDL
ncbi:MAG TPA: ATPase domain-containing protein, partial [Myxococcaceae bacterium]|nr:ATPase domain-containing protein [Myxococcaceae bacterium]